MSGWIAFLSALVAKLLELAAGGGAAAIAGAEHEKWKAAKREVDDAKAKLDRALAPRDPDSVWRDRLLNTAARLRRLRDREAERRDADRAGR